MMPESKYQNGLKPLRGITSIALTFTVSGKMTPLWGEGIIYYLRIKNKSIAN
jgi:hypothetical protein